MSIPKEPRQLMINIMYLVLTAMLALNVSAEIFNAFKIVDKGLVKSNSALKQSNDALPAAIKDGAKKKKSLETYAERIAPGRQLASDINDKIESYINTLIDQSGNANGSVDDGDYVEKGGLKELKGAKNKDITTRLLVDQGKGEELKADILAFQEKMLTYIDEGDRKDFLGNMPKMIDDEEWKLKASAAKNSAYNWSMFNFRQMPVQAVIPMLRKYQNDVRSSESAFLNYLASKVGTTTDVVLDRFAVVSAPEKTYVINSETFKTDVFLSASASGESNTGITISVNGQTLPVNKDGVATFSTKANGVGKKTYTVNASIKNPVTGEVQTFTKQYEYEVGERSAAISAAKMNVFYIGVDNPVEVSVAGVSSGQVKVGIGGAGGGRINKNGDGTYTVNVSSPTPAGSFATVEVSAPGFSATKNFRVKRIPDPVPMLSKSRGGKMGSGEFKAQYGLAPVLESFDFDARCEMVGYTIVRAPNRQDPEVVVNGGSKYTGDGQRLVSKAIPGDRFYFENIKCKCPGDAAARDLGSITFTIN